MNEKIRNVLLACILIVLLGIALFFACSMPTRSPALQPTPVPVPVPAPIPTQSECERQWVNRWERAPINVNETIRVQVISSDGLNIRYSGEVKDYNKIGTYIVGDVFEFNPKNIQIGDGYVWAVHNVDHIGMENVVGYSALCDTGGRFVYVTQMLGGFNNIIVENAPEGGFVIDNDCQLIGWDAVGSICTSTDIDHDGDVDQKDLDRMFECGWYSYKYRHENVPSDDDLPMGCGWFPTAGLKLPDAPVR